MKIVNVCRRFDPAHWGGTETVVAETGARLASRGHEVSVLASAALGAPGQVEVAGLAVERFRYDYPYLGLSARARAALDNAGGNLVSWPLLRRLLTMPRPDVVHLHTAGRLGGMVRMACRARGIPYLVSLHGGRFTIPPQQAAIFSEPLRGTIDLGKPLGAFFGARRVLADAAAVLAFSRAEADACREALPGTRVVHMAHGLDLARWRAPVSAEASPFRADAFPKLLCVGRIDPQKGQDSLIPLVAGLRRDYPQLQLLMIGSPTQASFAEQLSAQAREAGVADCVEQLGGLSPGSDTLRAAYRDASALLVPSRHEPFGIVALEGWASEVPVIASRTGGLIDLIGEDEAGLLVPLHRPELLAQRLRELLERPALAASLRKEGAARVAARHDWARVVDSLAELYAELSARPSGRNSAWRRALSA